jgi:hypothetical protein
VNLNHFTALIVLALLMPTGGVAQQREFYDTHTGKSIGRSTTDTSGTTTFDDAGGRGIGTVATQQKGEQRR